MICSVEEYRAKHSNMLDTKNVFDSSYTMREKISLTKKAEMKEKLASGICYVE